VRAPALVYLLSTGRTGSTLLELLLANHQGIETAGEAQLLPFAVSATNATCRCGSRFDVCPVWSAAMSAPSFDDDVRQLRRFRETGDAGRTVRTELLPEMLTGRVAPARRAEAEAYADASFELLGAVARPPRTRYVVDASKDLHRLHWLSSGADVPMRVVLLTRDPRGYVRSAMGNEPTDDPARILRLALRWSAQHLLMLRWLGAARPSWMLVRYEDLATRPGATLTTIGRWLGLDPEGFEPADPFRARSHGIAGNPMQFREAPIRLDDRWRELDPAAQRLVWTLTAFHARRLGYRWRSRW
jgi:hypothetical protein